MYNWFKMISILDGHQKVILTEIFIQNKIHFLSYKSVRIINTVCSFKRSASDQGSTDQNRLDPCFGPKSRNLISYRPALHGIVSIELPDHTNRLTVLELPFLSNITLTFTRGISKSAPG